jgi:PelA/Pel-15E family pectate lyase
MAALCRILLLSILAFSARASAQAPKEVGVHAVADFLALHVSGTVPPETTRVQYRHAESGPIAKDAAWTAVERPLDPNGEYSFDIPLKASRWSELEVRALKGEEVLASRTTRHDEPKFTMLTDEALAELPSASREAWQRYLKTSREGAARDYDALAAECRQLSLPAPRPAPGNRKEFEPASDPASPWFASDDAAKLAAVVITYQTPAGGWSKAVDYAAGPRSPGTQWTTGAAWHYCGTIDNRSTTEQIHFLAAVHASGKHAAAGVAAIKGIEWLLAAQYPNGGWPQNYPVERGYHEAITLNDDAMTHVLELLQQVSAGEAPYGFVEESLRQRATSAFNRGVAWLADAQVKVDGKPTVWCAQHHPLTLVPVAARLKEPPSLSGSESAVLIRFLMRKGPVTPEVQAMIESAADWLAAHAITGLRKTSNAAGKTDYVSDPASKEIYWTRFYDVQNGRPIFAGAQDGIIYDTFGEMAAKNKVGYDYFTTKPRDVIEKEAPKWRKRLGR